MVLFSKYKKVGRSFFAKFDFINTYGQKVNIDNKEEESYSLSLKESNIIPIFDFVGD